MKLSDKLGDIKMMATIAVSVCVLSGFAITSLSYVNDKVQQVNKNTEAIELAESEREEGREEIKTHGEILKNLIIKDMIDECTKSGQPIDKCPAYKKLVNPRFPEHSSSKRLSSSTT